MPKHPAKAHAQGIVVAHTHWDREWYATFEQSRIRLVKLIDGLLDLLEAKPSFRFFTLDGQTIVLEDYVAIRPENQSRLSALVRSGRLLIGPWYVLPDEFLVSGEALVRNLMMGAKAAAPFGPVMPVGYVPDPFGHIAQLPQILAGFGVDSFIFSRGLGDEGEDLGSEFQWQACDGTAVLAVHQIGWDDRRTGYLNGASLGYASPWTPRSGAPDFALAAAQLEELTAILRRSARTPFLLLNNGCDHLAPQPELPELLEYVNGVLADVTLVQGTLPQFIARVRAARATLDTFRGELRRARYAPLLSGVLSARMPLKQENDRCQTLLERWAEPFSAIAALEGGDYPPAFLWRAWQYLLWNHPHDSICGCSVDAVHADMWPRFAWVRQIGEVLVEQSLHHIGVRADRSALPVDAIPLVVFNPLSWSRMEVVRVSLELPASWGGASDFAVATSDGRYLPCQVLDRRLHQPLQEAGSAPVEQVTLAFVAAVPALGYSTFGLLPSKRTSSQRANPEPIIENETYRVAALSGGSFDIIHKPTGHIICESLLLADEADAGDEYTFQQIGDNPLLSQGVRLRSRLIHGGPLVWTIENAFDWPLPAAIAGDRQRRSLGHHACQVRVRVGLTAGGNRVSVSIDFENKVADHRLRLLLPTAVRSDHVAAAGHFTVLERPSVPPKGSAWVERPSATTHQAGFVDVSDGALGVALLAVGLPEYEARPDADGVTLALTLLRCVGWLSRDDLVNRPGHAGPGLATPAAQCPGSHTFECAVYVHEGDWHRAATERRALEHQLPLRAIPLPSARESVSPADLLPAVQSFLSLEGNGLVLSALKRSEDGRSLIVRVYNASAETVSGRLHLYRPIIRAHLARLDEREVSPLEPQPDGSLAFSAPGGKIVTFSIYV